MGTFVINPLVHIYEKEKIALKIAAKIFKRALISSLKIYVPIHACESICTV